MKKILIGVILPIVGLSALVSIIDHYQKNLSTTASIVSSLVQTLAIVIGGLWAYHKFGWEKKCENIITLKAILMEYTMKHNLSAMRFHIDKDVAQYKLRLLEDYNKLTQRIHLSYYVPKKLRKRIFDAIWLTIGNNAGEDYRKITANWEKYEKEIKEIYTEFDNIIDF